MQQSVWFDPRYIRGHVLPTVDNAYDIGSPSKRFRQAYFSSNIFTANAKSIRARDVGNTADYDMIQVDTNNYLRLGGAASQIHFYANSTIRFLIENYNLFYYGTAFNIQAITSDASDNSSINMSGGGAASNSRGGYLSLHGNEHANTGRIDLVAGNVSGGNISFNVNNGESFRINYSSNAELSFHKTNCYIRAGTSDGSDNGRIILSGGGNVDVTRGACLFLYGNEFATNGGFLFLNSGSISGAGVQTLVNSTNGTVETYVNSAATLVSTETHTSGTAEFRVAKNLSVNGAGSFGGGAGVISILNASTNPSSNPTGGGVLYSDAGALKWRGSSGTVTTIANA